MQKTHALILFSLLAVSKTASFNYRNAKSEFSEANYEFYNANEDEDPGFEFSKVNDDIRIDNNSFDSVNVDYEHDHSEIESGRNDVGVTAFGYHMKVGVLRAIELMRSEGLDLTSRIVGGSQVTSASVNPHQAGIVARLMTGWLSVCGGSLIANTRVLTAAHCWWDGENQANLFTIVLGSVTILTGGTRIDTSSVKVHPNWNTKDITNDIAMVTITSVTYNNNIQAIPLPTLADVNLDFAGMTGVVSGYGRTSDAQTGTTTNLHQVSVNIIMNSVCQSSFPTVTLHNSHLCSSGAGNVGSCDGDSGGPLTTIYNNKRTLIGVVSFGLSEGCRFGNPSVYTRVTTFLNWIQANV